MNTLDCLDYGRSKYRVLRNGTVGSIEEMFFKEDQIGDDVWMFRLSLKGMEEAYPRVYVTEKFRNAATLCLVN